MESQKSEPNQNKGGSVARGAFLFGMGTMTSRVAGFIRDVLVVSVFGREVTDAWYTAFKLPNMFRRLFGEGALSVSFIPVFVETRQQGDEAEIQRLINGVMSLLLLLIFFMITLGLVFMEPIIDLWVGGKTGFGEVPGKIENTVLMARVSLFFLFFILMFAYFMAILNGLKKFGLSGLAPVFLNIALIGGALYADFTDSKNVLILPIAALVGGALQAGILIPDLMKQGYLPRPSTHIYNRRVRQVLKALGPSLVGLGIVQMTGIVNFRFASFLEQGSITYLNVADRLLELPLSLIAVSLQTALLPTLTDYFSRGEKAKMASTANHYLRINYFLAVPSAMGLFMLGQEIVEVLFVWGKFSKEEAMISGQLLKVYAFTLLTAAGIRIMSQSFYAMKNTLLPAKVSAISFFIHIGMAYYLTDVYGLLGLVIASLITASLNFTMLSFLFRRNVGSLEFAVLIKRVAGYFVCGLPISAIGFAFGPLTESISDSRIFKALALFLSIGLSGLAYFAIAHMFSFPEYHEVSRSLLGKIKRKLKR